MVEVMSEFLAGVFACVIVAIFGGYLVVLQMMNRR
jgi:hypothetical protein